MQGLILIDKISGITSFDVCAFIRTLTGEKHIGHTGTLDPLATGVLPVFIGKATSLSSFVLNKDKQYIAKVRLGITTDTDDITGTVIKKRTVSVSKENVLSALKNFTGKQMQTPPVYSAIKKNGKRLCDIARAGGTELPKPREITVFSLFLLSEIQNGEFEIEVTCSKGTYIRSLVRDIGEYLGCGAVMTELRRTAVGSFGIEDTVKLSELNEDNIESKILPCEYALSNLNEIFVSENQARRFSNGNELDASRLAHTDFCDGEMFRVKYDSLFLGLGFYKAENNSVNPKCIINSPAKNGTAIALGTFDGVHKGHRAVLSEACKYKNAVALTFIKPPKCYFTNENIIITDYAEKKELIEKAGIKSVCALDFEKIRNTSPNDFLNKLYEEYSPVALICGENYRFGKDGSGDTDLLRKFCAEKGIRLTVCPFVRAGGDVISSSRVRALLKDGNARYVKQLLGRNFAFEGIVIHGNRLARTLGFPTVNTEYPSELVYVRFGVYLSKILLDGKKYDAVTNIGTRPTVDGKRITAESHILNFSGDVYGHTVKIELLDFIRQEKKFNSVAELKEVALLDIAECRRKITDKVRFN